MIGATIDVNFLNGGNFGENDARGIVHLEHLKQFRTWNNTASHPLHGKVDLNRIAIVGHSRGGEGVGHASFFNRLTSIKPDILTPVVPLDGSAGLGPVPLQPHGGRSDRADRSAVSAAHRADRRARLLSA